MQLDSLFYFNVRRTFALPKSNKLKSIVAITQLFDEGKHDFQYPLKLVYIKRPRGTKYETFKAAVSVPKKIFKKAVDRNLLKRKIREALRLNQQVLIAYCEAKLTCIDLMLIYTGKEICPNTQIDKAVRSLFEKITKDVQ